MPTIPDPGLLKPETPLRLGAAAKVYFPDGSITAKSLRREALKGNLAVFRIAGKDFTTLAALDEMIRRCHVRQIEPGSTSDAQRVATPSEMERRRSAQASLLAKMAYSKEQKKRGTSPANMQ